MSTNTRKEAKAAFNHVLDNILGRDDSSDLKKALVEEGIQNIFDLLTLEDSFIDDLVLADPKSPGHPTVIKRGDKNLLKCFGAYKRSLDAQQVNIVYTTLSQLDFDSFRIGPDYNVTSSATAIVPTPSSSSSYKPPVVLTPADHFRRGIKRDPSLFPTLKDEKYHDTWHRSFANQARAQAVSEVLDSSFKPTTPEEIELFAEKQKYLYAVLEAKILTDRGKAIIRDHEVDFDAQQVYKRLQDYHLKSTKALIESSSILSYITGTRLGDGTWLGTVEGFITNWQNQVRLYEKHVPTTDHFSEGQKRVMLQNAVHSNDELRQVKNNADLLQAQSGSPLTYEEYSSLLLAAAAAHDEQYKPKKVKRQVFSHTTTESNECEDVNEDYDIDYPVSSIQAFATNSRPPSNRPPNGNRVRMSTDKWYGLDEKSRSIWDQLDDNAKAVILGYQSGGGSSRPSTNRPPPSYRPPVRPQANLHDISAYDYLHANMHETGPTSIVDETTNNEVDPVESESNEETTLLVNAAKSFGKTHLPPGNVRRVMSKTSTRLANVAMTEYRVSFQQSMDRIASLIDRGANGGVAGDDVRVIFKTNRSVDIRGIDNHHVNDIGIGTVGGVVHTQKGPVIAIMHQYALLGKGSSIHSACQMEWYKNDVNDKSIHVPGGSQRIKTLEGYIIPLTIQDGLVRLVIRPYTDQEFDTLPHVFLTSEMEWDPSGLDHTFDTDTQWGDPEDGSDLQLHKYYDEFGDYRQRVTVHHLTYFTRQDGNLLEDVIDQCVLNVQEHLSIVHTPPLEDDAPVLDQPLNQPIVINKRDPDFHQLRPLFGWLSADIIKRTFEHTTQYARIPSGTLLKRSFKSPNPALNVSRRSESVACDIVYADTPAISNGANAAVIFVGTDTQVTDVYGIKTDKQFVNTLEDNITQRGAPHKLISDSAQVIISNKVQDILRTLCISSWQSEPYQQHQNAAERRYQTIKQSANRLLDRTGAPSDTWLLCLQYVCFLLNHTYNSNIDGVPLNHLTGITVDISVLLRFHFWQKVYYKSIDSDFPSDSGESMGHIVGISEHCGHALTWQILTSDTKRIINRSVVRPYDPADPNLRADLIGGEMKPDEVIKSRHNLNDVTNSLSTQPNVSTKEPPSTIPIINPQDLIGHTFLLDKQEDGQQFRAKIVKLIDNHSSDLEDDKTRIKFLLNVNDDTSEEIITYNQLLQYLSKDMENDVLWKFQRITSHQGPLAPTHPDYNGSVYNVMVEWENGETTLEPLSIIAKDDPVTCAIYAKENGLLDTPGWKQFKAIAKREKKFIRQVNQAKLRSYKMEPKFKNGFEIPKTYEQAMRIDEKNGNTKWQDAVEIELSSINEYETFLDKGHHTKAKAPIGYKKIRVHLIFDVKHDGRHKARLVADGHLTDVPLESVYSGVVSLRGFRLVLFIGELNKLELWATDIGNAYLEAFTSEKVFIIGGPEFKGREGHILIISKALYGLRSSGARWHDRFADCVSALGFFPCKSEPDIWMRKVDNIYEYIAVYVDDLAMAMKNPREFVDILENKHKFKTKGTGPIGVHLGMDFSRDEDGTLCISPAKYIDKLVKNYEKLFGEYPKQVVTSPLEKGDHPEIDTSDLLDFKGIQMYQSMIGALQWVVTIGRFDITTAVMTMSGFRIAPRKGHLERLKRIYGYLSKMRHAAIRIRTEEPDYSDIPDFNYDWSRSVYGELTEIVPHDAPEPLGKYVTLTHYVDANLMHDIVTGRSVTGILHLVNKTPIEWFSKKQATVETATYGSEFVSARTCVEQVIDIRNTLRYLGVPIRDKSYMFGDNKSVVDSSMTVHAKLHKRHTMLSFHRVREAIASGMIGFYFIPGEFNPSDILSKHWGYSQIWPQLKALLFWKGDTEDIED